ncbi:MAG: CocE/NonD family hydrolase C-terminal non-catalytic domain-containing protein, partial [Acidimicrobiales bacterium]
GGPSQQATTPLSTAATPLHLYQMGSGAWNAQQHTGAWYDTADWPVTDGSGGYAATKLYLGPSTSTGGAASGLESGTSPALSDNQGTLSTTAPSLPTGADTVLYTGASSPCDLNSDQWGAGALQSGQAGGGSTLAWPCDQNDTTLGAGPGALTYTSAPVSQTEVIAGPIDASVYATATTIDTELVADVEEVSPQGQSTPLTTGALLGSLRATDSARSWIGDDGAPLMAFHPYTQESQQPVV